MDLGLNGKVIMIAAASKGLGFGIAQALSREGAKVSIASRTLKEIQKAAEALQEETGSEALGTVFDATEASSIIRWADTTCKKFGGIDGLVVNAGGPPIGFFDDFDDDVWTKAFELTLLSAVRMIRAVLPSMRERGGGSIVTMTSSSVKEPIDALILSNVMRSGVTSLAKSLSQQLAKYNIRVNNLVPGRFDTDRVRALDKKVAEGKGIRPESEREGQEKLIPLGRYGTCEEFGKAGAFLMSEASSYITGETFIVDGGTMKTVW
jgi:3-oxoacyl-[acyl-carrier protein] reductase